MKDFEHKSGMHKIVEGVAVRTPYAKRRELELKYKRAGVPDIIINANQKELQERAKLKSIPRVASRLSKPRILWMQADSLDDVMLCRWSFIVREYIDKGIDARCMKINDIIAARFDKDENRHIQHEIKEIPCLVIDLTNSDHHKWLPSVIGDIHATRSRMMGTTIYLSDENIATMPGKYGQTVSKIFDECKGIKRLAPRNKRKINP